MSDWPGADPDRILVAQLTGEAQHRAKWRELTADEEAAAVTELRELAAGRADLLAEVAGVLEGASARAPGDGPVAGDSPVVGLLCRGGPADRIAARLPGRASWEHVDSQDIQQWMTWLLDRYSNAYASNQYRALQQFFKWLAAEDQLPDPMERLQPPPVTDKLVPVFTSEELTRLEQACAGRSFAQRRDSAIIAVLRATGIRLSELAGLRYDPGDPQCGDVDLWQREITVRVKGGKPRIVRIGHQAARSLDRYIRARSRHAQAWRPQLWLGAGNREPVTAAGIYQMITRRGRQCGVDAFPHRFRHHFSHTWLDRGGPEGDLMELNGWASPQMLRRYGASARSARARRTYDRIMTDT